jgi:mannosyl-oligosaccharide alpha-1,2-mannosidase
MRSYRRNPVFLSKICCAAFILAFYCVYSRLHPPALTKGQPLPKRPTIQYDAWQNTSDKADVPRQAQVKLAMAHTFHGYKTRAWGYDDIKPISGGHSNSRTGWGAFIVDSSTSLAVMGMWKELAEELDFIAKIDFRVNRGTVDVFETTVQYLGALVSLVELGDAKIIPANVFTSARRRAILAQATLLADHILLAFDYRTGLLWLKPDFRPRRVVSGDEPLLNPAQAGSNFLELCSLSKLTGSSEYCGTATMAWSSLVRDRYLEEIPGLVDGPISARTGAPTGKFRHFDKGHGSYYEYLVKANLLLPDSANAKLYKDRWIQAAEAVRNNLTSRSDVSKGSTKSHLFMGKWNGPWFMNEMSHEACFAAGNLLLGGRHFQRDDLVVLGQAVLEGCRHVHHASPTGLGPEAFSWNPAPGQRNGTFEVQSARQKDELAKYGYWVAEPAYRLRPEYFESLFYAFRTTGEKRYRDWAWEAFNALEKHCKTEHGYAGVQDVTAKDGSVAQIDFTDAYWAAESLKYLYLIFDDVKTVNLDEWIFTTAGHIVRRGR